MNKKKLTISSPPPRGKSLSQRVRTLGSKSQTNDNEEYGVAKRGKLEVHKGYFWKKVTCSLTQDLFKYNTKEIEIDDIVETEV